MKRMMPAIFWFGLGLSLLFTGGCPKKEEERIVITIQTEKVEEAPPAAALPAATSEARPKEAAKEREPESSATGGSGGPPSVVAKAPPRSLPASPAPPTSIPEKPEISSESPQAPPVKKFSEEVVSPAPVGLPQQPSALPPDQPMQDEDQIIAIVQRQEEAFEKKDVDLYTMDLSDASPKTGKDFKRIVDQLDTIDVRFEIEEITVKESSAQVILRQTTHLVPKRGGKTQSTKARILWGLIKVGGEWKIKETRILEKY